MAVFPLLADPARYRACETDLLSDQEARRYWLDLYATHLHVQLEAAASAGVPDSNLDAARAEFLHELDLIRTQPDRYGKLDILLLAKLRQRALLAHGIGDEFRLIKNRENDAALSELFKWLARIDRTREQDRIELIVTGMLAGNLFDMGAPATAERFSRAAESFDDALSRVPHRPWLFDDMDAVSAWWCANAPRKAVMFADNAGADAMLGLLPLAREMLKRGVEVVIAANREPCLNDVTHDELRGLLREAAKIDPAFASDRLRIVQSGSDWPLIDLTDISDQLAEQSSGADLIVLIGMGRGIESNFSAPFMCQSWTIAMIKDPQVAKSLGGSVYDAVFRRKLLAPGNL